MTQVYRFRMAAAKHLGRQLTPEIAAAIEVDAFTEPDLTIDGGRFAPEHYDGYVIAVERFRDILDELKPLHTLHYAETEAYRHGLALNPDYDQVQARERAGRAIQFTVRKDGELVGHLLIYLGLSVHTQTPIAEEDALFIREDHRGGYLAMHLLRYAERAIVAVQGPTCIKTNSKVVNRADVLMRRLKYPHIANQFAKFVS